MDPLLGRPVPVPLGSISQFRVTLVPSLGLLLINQQTCHRKLSQELQMNGIQRVANRFVVGLVEEWEAGLYNVEQIYSRSQQCRVRFIRRLPAPQSLCSPGSFELVVSAVL